MPNLSERNAASIIDALSGNKQSGMCRCPVHSHGKRRGDKNPSLRVSEHHGVILVKCHAGCSQDAVIDTLRTMNLWPRKWRAPQPSSREHNNDDEEARRLDCAMDILNAAIPLPDLTERQREIPQRYLAGRGLKAIPRTARLLTAGRSSQLGQKPFPAIVYPVVNRDREIVGVHSTWLAKDGSEKLNARGNKKQFGPISGGYVRFKKIDPDQPLIIAEGIETALSAARIADCQAICALSATNMPNVVPPDCAEIIIAADNDKPGIDAAKVAARNFTGLGVKIVRIAVPDKDGCDWNDMLRSGADRDELRRSILRAPLFEAADGLSEDELEARLEEIAKLSTHEYERQRKALSRELGWRASVLDVEIRDRRELTTVESSIVMGMTPTEPWHEPVDGKALLFKLRSILLRFVKLPKGAATGTALWIMHTYAHDAAVISPILMISSPLPGCGKTTLMRVLRMLVTKPLSGANVTPSVVFRVIEKFRPTMLLDEADTFIKHNNDLRGVLDCGHERTGAYILRNVGDHHEPKQFCVWAPKAIALIGRMHPTLEDRSIKIELIRKRSDDVLEQIPRDPDAFLKIRRQIARWFADHEPELRDATPKAPEELKDRAKDNWEALLAIANACGGDWPERAREAALTLSGKDDDQSHLILLLQDLKEMFARHGRNLSSQEIVSELCDMEDRPWGEFNRDQPITAHGVAKLLADLKIGPKQVRLGDRRTQGYREEQFRFVFERYLPRTGGATSDTPDNATNSDASMRKETLTRVRIVRGRDRR